MVFKLAMLDLDNKEPDFDRLDLAVYGSNMPRPGQRLNPVTPARTGQKPMNTSMYVVILLRNVSIHQRLSQLPYANHDPSQHWFDADPRRRHALNRIHKEALCNMC